MAHIKSRKHSVSRRLNHSAAVALAVMAIPGAAFAQQTGPADTTLPAVNVTGVNEGYKPEKASSPKYTQPLVDTPQTITVIKKEVLQEQGGFTLTEALRNTPGITLQLGENGNTQSGDSISMRGFDTQNSIFIDGVRDLGSFTRDMFNIEQVEVLKGPTGADTGRASAGGYINLQSKTPQAGEFFNASTSYGTEGRYRVTADVNRGISEDGSSAVRLNLMKQGGGVAGRDFVKNESYGIAPSIAFGLNTPTRTTLSLLHTKQDNRPDGGVPTVGLKGYRAVIGGNGATAITAGNVAAANAASAVDSSNFYGSIYDFDKVEANMLTAKVEHDISEKLTLRNTFRIGKAEQYRMVTSIIGIAFVNPADPASWTVARNRADGMNRFSDGGQGKVQTNEVITNQTQLSAEIETAGVKHKIGTGLELIYERQNKNHLAGASGGTGLNGGTVPAANLYNPDPGFALVGYNPRENGAYDRGVTKTIGIYAFDTIELNEKWQVSAGIRADRFDTDFETYRIGGTTNTGGGGTTTMATNTFTKQSASDTLWSYKFGSVYKPTRDSSLYALYSVSQRPPGGDAFSLSTTANNSNNPIADPQKATNIEIGAKWDVNKNLSLTTAVFNTVNKNEYATDVNGATSQIGERRVRGVELGAVGQITPAWQVITGLTFLDSEITSGNNNAGATNNGTGGAIPFTPKRAFTSWTTYRLPAGLTIGGGARYVSKITRSSIANATPQTGLTESASYWVADAMASYEVTKNATIQLNIYNVFDKDYVASFNSGGGRYTPGTPRSFLVTGNFKF